MSSKGNKLLMIFQDTPWIWFIPVFIVLLLIVVVFAICYCKWPRRRKIPAHVDPRIILRDVNHVEVISNPGVPASPSMPNRFSTISGLDGILVRKVDLSTTAASPPEVPKEDPPPLPSRPASFQHHTSHHRMSHDEEAKRPSSLFQLDHDKEAKRPPSFLHHHHEEEGKPMSKRRKSRNQLRLVDESEEVTESHNFSTMVFDVDFMDHKQLGFDLDPSSGETDKLIL